MKNGKRLLFLTNFSEACFQAIPALAEWQDREEGHLSLLHVHTAGRVDEDRARKAMRSFFAEADRYARCERLLLAGNAERMIVDYCRRMRPDIVFAPASHPAGFPRVRHRSLRASLLRRGRVKVWSRGRSGHPVPARRPAEDVAYVMTGHAAWHREAEMAAHIAARQGARFHLIHLTTMQAMHDGTLPQDVRIGHPEVLVQELNDFVKSLPCPPVIHFSAGDEFRELPRLLAESHAATVFLGERHALRRDLFGYSVNRDLEKLDCEFICFPETESIGDPKENEADLAFTLLPGYLR